MNHSLSFGVICPHRCSNGFDASNVGIWTFEDVFQLGKLVGGSLSTAEKRVRSENKPSGTCLKLFSSLKALLGVHPLSCVPTVAQSPHRCRRYREPWQLLSSWELLSELPLPSVQP